MSWEKRRGHLYYYRVHRQGDRVLKEYIGCGPHAVATAEQDAASRAERVAQQQAEQEHRRLDLVLLEQVEGVGTEVQAHIEAALLVAGYRRSQRKPWQKRKSRRIRDGKAAKEGRPQAGCLATTSGD